MLRITTIDLHLRSSATYLRNNMTMILMRKVRKDLKIKVLWVVAREAVEEVPEDVGADRAEAAIMIRNIKARKSKALTTQVDLSG